MIINGDGSSLSACFVHPYAFTVVQCNAAYQLQEDYLPQAVVSEAATAHSLLQMKACLEQQGVQSVQHPILDRVRRCSSAPDAAASFFTALLHPLESHRPTAAEALQHAYIKDCAAQMRACLQLDVRSSQGSAVAPRVGSANSTLSEVTQDCRLRLCHLPGAAVRQAGRLAEGVLGPVPKLLWCLHSRNAASREHDRGVSSNHNVNRSGSDTAADEDRASSEDTMHDSVSSATGHRGSHGSTARLAAFFPEYVCVNSCDITQNPKPASQVVSESGSSCLPEPGSSSGGQQPSLAVDKHDVQAQGCAVNAQEPAEDSGSNAIKEEMCGRCVLTLVLCRLFHYLFTVMHPCCPLSPVCFIHSHCVVRVQPW